jgi:hypothetical protein
MPNQNWPAVIPIPEATGDYLSPKTTETTRIDFTEFFMRFQHAPDAHPMYKHVFVTHQQLAKLLIEHPAMRPNLQQTFSTPANSKNKVYFMWDFVLRTFQHLAAQVDPRDPLSSPMFSDVVGRAWQAKFLTIDETGELNKMNASVGYSDDNGVEFTDEIKALANTLDNLPDGCAGCGKEKRDNGKLLMVCAKCKEEKYCSTDCQKKRWKSHKRHCEPAPATAA